MQRLTGPTISGAIGVFRRSRRGAAVGESSPHVSAASSPPTASLGLYENHRWLLSFALMNPRANRDRFRGRRLVYFVRDRASARRASEEYFRILSEPDDAIAKRSGERHQPPVHSRAVRRGWRWNLLLIVPFIGTLWVPFYNAVEPNVAGIPYFYWYQFVWVGIGAALTAIVYFATRAGDP